MKDFEEDEKLSPTDLDDSSVGFSVVTWLVLLAAIGVLLGLVRACLADALPVTIHASACWPGPGNSGLNSATQTSVSGTGTQNSTKWAFHPGETDVIYCRGFVPANWPTTNFYPTLVLQSNSTDNSKSSCWFVTGTVNTPGTNNTYNNITALEGTPTSTEAVSVTPTLLEVVDMDFISPFIIFNKGTNAVCTNIAECANHELIMMVAKNITCGGIETLSDVFFMDLILHPTAP